MAADAASMITEVVEGAGRALRRRRRSDECLLETTASYASTREQFGVPIASFQALAHRLADMKIASIQARSTLLCTIALAEADVQALGTSRY